MAQDDVINFGWWCANDFSARESLIVFDRFNCPVSPHRMAEFHVKKPFLTPFVLSSQLIMLNQFIYYKSRILTSNSRHFTNVSAVISVSFLSSVACRLRIKHPDAP